MASAAAQSFLLSRIADPIFAIGVGLTATAMKIQREQTEQHPEQDNGFPALWQKAQKLNRIYWGYEDQK